MTEKALETLSDDQLLSMVLPDIPSVGNYTDDELMNLAQTEMLDSIDTKSGADAGVRAQVAAAQSPNDKIATLKKFFPDAIPVEVLDPRAERLGLVEVTLYLLIQRLGRSRCLMRMSGCLACLFLPWETLLMQVQR